MRRLSGWLLAAAVLTWQSARAPVPGAPFGDAVEYRNMARHLARGKSILLLGPRQTGKTTLLGGLKADLEIALVSPRARQRYERDPSLLAGEVQIGRAS